ncbi:pyridoxamine 5'-phosphate oxidase [Paraferrimonas sp. SM1919]|uniref:pyridoxamine 5'-phosphate oxidase n=1 Tax=Paraferrimonas sp. SM1919 TaxID=2662263 RepID=UPI0013D5174C|nr:pyridoxamine 5'-phosphate oxidase [Paraferrimonas sp. SM1919]
MSDIKDLRREYKQGGLRSKDLPENPLKLFELWLEQAQNAGLMDPTAMVVATVDERGMPFQRTVLLKKFDEQGFVFFTNTGSRKASHIKQNNKVSLLFPWTDLDRQVAICGIAKPLPTADVMRYFASRPKDSQIGAWVSEQSSRISARGVLEAKFLEMKNKFSKGEVPLPTFWGGYVIEPESIEFWQGGDRRLHDRFIFDKDDNGHWQNERLAP